MELNIKPARAATVIIILVSVLVAAAMPWISAPTKAVAGSNPRCPLSAVVG